MWPIRVHCIKKFKMNENEVTNFYEKIEREMNDFVRFSVTFSWNKFLWSVGKKIIP